jgi:hypothetical protein
MDGLFTGLIGGIQGLTTILQGQGMVNAGYGQAQLGQSINTAGATFAAAGIRQAAQVATQGGAYSAAVYRQASAQSVQEASYEIDIDRYNTANQNDALSRQIQEVFSTNRATMAANGFSAASGSYLSVQSAALDRLTTQVIQNHNAAIQRQKNINYQGLLSSYNFENQARGSEYQAAVQSVQLENQARGTEYQAQLNNLQLQYQADLQSWNASNSMFDSIGGIMGNISGAF